MNSNKDVDNTKGISDGLSSVLPTSLTPLVERLRSQDVVRHLLYVPGPGDVAKTYRHWAKGHDDPSIPSIGYSHQVYELVEKLGAKLTVLSEHPVKPPRKNQTLSDQNVQFRHFKRPGGKGIGYHLSEIYYGLRVLFVARQLGADTILFQRGHIHLWPLGLAKLLGIRLIFSLHNTLWPAHRGPTQRERRIGRCNGWAFRRATSVIGVSEAIVAQVRQVAGPKYNRVRFQAPQYKAELEGVSRSREPITQLRKLIYVGRIEVNKGVFLLLQAFTKLATKYPDLNIEFIGDGQALAQLRIDTNALPTADRVNIYGQVSGTVVFDRLKQADLLVCPTTSHFAEGLAKTPIEAALYGVPSIISSTVPAGALLGKATKTVVTDDVDVLSDAIEELIQHPDRLQQMAQATKAQCSIFFDRRYSLAARVLEALE